MSPFLCEILLKKGSMTSGIRGVTTKKRGMAITRKVYVEEWTRILTKVL